MNTQIERICAIILAEDDATVESVVVPPLPKKPRESYQEFQTEVFEYASETSHPPKLADVMQVLRDTEARLLEKHPTAKDIIFNRYTSAVSGIVEKQPELDEAKKEYSAKYEEYTRAVQAHEAALARKAEIKQLKKAPKNTEKYTTLGAAHTLIQAWLDSWKPNE